MKHPARVVFLTTIWVLLWGRLSVANVVSGLLVSTLLLVLYPTGATGRDGGRVRPIAIVKLVGYVAVQVVVSNVLLTRRVLSRHPNVRTGIVACPLHDHASARRRSSPTC